MPDHNNDDVHDRETPVDFPITKDFRRTVFLSEALEPALIDIELARQSSEDAHRAQLAAIHLHLSRAWDDGAASLASHISMLNTAKSHIAVLQSEVGSLRTEVSELRNTVNELLKLLGDLREAQGLP